MRLWALLIVIFILIADQASKHYVLQIPDLSNQPVDIFSFFRIVLVYNQGVSFGMFSQLESGRIILTGLAGVITVFVTYWLFTAKEKGVILALSFIIGGAIGNIIDRLRFGHVVDFLDFYIGSYHWPAFNIADSTIFLGVVYLCIEQFFFHNKEKTR